MRRRGRAPVDVSFANPVCIATVDMARIGLAEYFASLIITTVRRPRRRFARAIGRFVAWPLPGLPPALNVYASMRETSMKNGIRVLALGIAIGVNGAALMAANASMVGGAERELASQHVERVVIVATREDRPAQQTVAIQNCPAPRAL